MPFLSYHRETNLRSFMFIAIFFIAFLGEGMFLRNDVTIAELLSRESSSIHYLYLTILGSIIFYILWNNEKFILKSMIYPALYALLAWIAVSVVMSTDVNLSIKKFIIVFVISWVYATTFVLPRSKEHLAVLLTIIAYFIIILSYFGTIFFPMYSIHQATDVAEPQLAGNWRGVFNHKNGAGILFCIITFIGYYLFTLKRYKSAIPMIILSLFFVFMTQAKTATISFFFVTFVTALAFVTTIKFIRNFMLVIVPTSLSIIGFGQVLHPTILNFVLLLPIDHTFTGRDVVWNYVLDSLKHNLLFGFGFNAFWESAKVKIDRDELIEAGIWAQHAHQSFVDIANMMGLPGLAVFIWWAIIQPLKDIDTIIKKKHDFKLMILLVLIWEYSLATATMESYLLRGFYSGWLPFCFAVFGLRFLSLYDVEKGKI